MTESTAKAGTIDAGKKTSSASVLIEASRAVEGAVARMVHSTLAAHRNLSSELNRFRCVRAKTLETLADVTEDQARWSPRASAWSIAQIADHLLRSEELYREQWLRMIQLARDGKTQTIRIRFEEVDTSIALVPRDLITVFEFPLRVFNRFVPTAVRETMVRYPFVAAVNPKASQPRADLKLEKLRADLAASLAETEKLLRGPLPPNFERMRMDHPVIGNNNPIEMCRIMIAHEERHQGQIAHIRRNSKFPKASATA